MQTPVHTLLWSGNSISSWTTETGSTTFTLVGGETLAIWNDGVANIDQGPTMLQNIVTGQWYIPKRVSYNPFWSSGGVYGGWQLMPNAPPGTYRVVPFLVNGGSDGIVRLSKITGLGVDPLRTQGHLDQPTSSKTITIVTTGNPFNGDATGKVFTGDFALGGRTHENTVGSIDTITPPSGWTSYSQYLDGNTNVPTDNSYYYVPSGNNNAVLSATWTSADNAISDTCASVIVLAPLLTNMTFTAQPTSTTGTVGGFVSYTVAVTGQTGTPSYAWYIDGTLVSTTVEATALLKVPRIGLQTVYCIVTDSNGSTQSLSTTLLGFRANKPIAKRRQTPNHENGGIDFFKGALDGTATLDFDPSEINPQTTSSGGAVFKVWNGTGWVTGKPRKVWNGSAWVAKPAKVWSGTAWITCT